VNDKTLSVVDQGVAQKGQVGGYLSKGQLGVKYFTQHVFQQLSLFTGKGAPKPSMLCGLVNWECNYRCYFCAHPYYAERPVLTFQTWHKVLKDLRRWLGIFRMNFLGGEPFLRNDFVDILSCSRRLGVMTGITTNASLINKELADQLGKLNLFSIGISLDGATAETHERVRGCPGCFEKVMNALEYLRTACDMRTNIVIRVIVMKDNLDELVNIVSMVKKLNLTGVIFQPLDPHPVLDGKPPDVEMPSFDFPTWVAEYDSHRIKDSHPLKETVSELISMKQAGEPILNSPASLEQIFQQISYPESRQPGRCAVGVRNLMILPNGDVHTCCDTVNFKPIGNISEHKIDEIWRSRIASRRRYETRKCEKTCLFFSHAQRSLLDNARMFLKYVRAK
jgi:MoaA/NifB/PqqE/SkfB family radical SAM enzyme